MSITVNKEALVTQIADKAQLTKVQANQALTAAVEAIMQAVEKRGKVTLVGFGTFEGSDRKAREGRNPQTGESLTIPAKRVPKFSPGAEFKRRVEEGDEF